MDVGETIKERIAPMINNTIRYSDLDLTCNRRTVDLVNNVIWRHVSRFVSEQWLVVTKHYFEDEKFYDKLVNDALDYFLTKIPKQDNCTMTLDEILDKISEQGINSLTTEEKNKLDEYSKTQL